MTCYFQEHPNHALMFYNYHQSHLQPLAQFENSKARESLLISRRWETALQWTGLLSWSLNVMNRVWKEEKVGKFFVHISMNRLKLCLAHLCLVWKLKLDFCIRESPKIWVSSSVHFSFLWQILELTGMY